MAGGEDTGEGARADVVSPPPQQACVAKKKSGGPTVISDEELAMIREPWYAHWFDAIEDFFLCCCNCSYA